jgi:hypothetical protein
MKTKTIFSVVILICLFSWQCKKNEDSGIKSLKESLNSNVQSLNFAVNEIAKTKGYQLIALSTNGTQKSVLKNGPGFQDSITLAKIAGIYEYKPVYTPHWCFLCYDKLFNKTGSSNQLIVKLPSEKVFHPNRFCILEKADTALKNNFVVTATDYHLYLSQNLLFDYKLAANVVVSDTAVGSIGVESNRNLESGFDYNSEYTFPNGYKIQASFVSGDTATSSISLSDPSNLLLKETVSRIISTNHRYRDKEYSLIIGNVEIRKSVSDSISIYLNGVKQQNAKVEFITQVNTGEAGGICRSHDRDMKITFEDGTTALVSDLLSPSMTILQNMAQSLGDVYFAKNIIDYIAVSIYYNH